MLAVLDGSVSANWHLQRVPSHPDESWIPQLNWTLIPSSVTSANAVDHTSPGATGGTRVRVPVVTISPAARGGLTESHASSSTRWRRAESGPPRTLDAWPRSTTSPSHSKSTVKVDSTCSHSSLAVTGCHGPSKRAPCRPNAATASGAVKLHPGKIDCTSSK